MVKFLALLAFAFYSTAAAQLPVTQKNPAVFQQGVSLTGGNLTLFQDPTLDMHACTKQYVDDEIALISEGAELALDATHLNTAGAIVKRDGSGGFAAGAITATDLSSTGDAIIDGELSVGTIHTADITNNAIVNGVFTALGGSQFTGTAQFDNTVTVNGNLSANAQLKAASSLMLDVQTDSSTTGSNAAAAPSKPTVVFTNASLASIGSVTTPLTGENHIFVNRTGASITIVNEYASATAANRILTGTAADLSVANEASIALVYNSNNSRWQVVGGSGSGSGGSSGNLLTDYGFELGGATWTSSGGSFGTTTTAANVFEGAKAGTWDSSSAGQTLTTQAVAVNGRGGTNGEFTCRLQNTSGVATHLIEVTNGTDIIVSQSVSSNSNYLLNTVNFAYPSSGSVYGRIKSVASNEPNVNVDDCYLGPARNIGTVSQAQLVGTAVITGCGAQFQLSGTSYANFAAGSGCSTTLTGQGVTAGSGVLGIKFNSLQPGEYVIVGEGGFGQVTAAKTSYFRFSDGTNATREISHIYGASGSAPNVTSLSHSLTYLTPQTNVTLQIQAKVDSGGTAYLNADANTSFTVKVFRFPLSSEQAYRPELHNWKVDANISGSNPSLGTSDQSSYVGIEDSALTLTNNSGSGNLIAQIPCSSTNASSGTTCSAGSESVGVSFTLPRAGDVLACVSTAHILFTGASGAIDATFQIVETPNNAQTISQEGKSRVSSTNFIASSILSHPLRICGTFTFASAGQKTLRLFYEQDVTATVSGNVLAGDADAAKGQRDIHWEVYPITQNLPAPVLIGSVTSNSPSAERIERATLNLSGATTVAITSQSGSWLSGATASGFVVTADITAGIFSATPTCSVTCNSGANTTAGAHFVAPTNLQLQTVCWNASNGGQASSAMQIICMGPR